MHPSLTLLRYLRANQFNYEKTIEHIQRNIAWRKDYNVDELMKLDPEIILGCKLEDLTAFYPHWQSGLDKTGRPVIYKQYGKFDASKVKKLVGGTFDNVIKYHVWEQEVCSIICTHESHKLGNIIETSTHVIDVKDMKLSQITSDFMSLVKLFAEIDQKQYPETLGKMFIINVPSIFPFVWKGIKTLLDPATASKINICGGPKEYEPILKKFIGEDNLPQNYGGTLPSLNNKVVFCFIFILKY